MYCIIQENVQPHILLKTIDSKSYAYLLEMVKLTMVLQTHRHMTYPY